MEKYGIPKKVDHDEKSGTVLEEKGDVPVIHRSVKYVRHPREAFWEV
jgi:hypothetical protein